MLEALRNLNKDEERTNDKFLYYEKSVIMEEYTNKLLDIR